jgi:hypothetical protein
LGQGGRYARSRGVGGRKLLLGVSAREQTVGRGGQRGRMSRDCARRNRGGGRREAAHHRKAEENSGAWPCSDIIIFEGGVGLIRASCHTLQYKTAHQFEFCLSRRRDFYGLDAFFTRCRVEETQESLVRLDAVVGGLFGDLEGELQGISLTQSNRIRAFCKGDPV